MRISILPFSIVLLFLSLASFSWGNAQCSTNIIGPGVWSNGYACAYSNNSDSDVDYFISPYQATWNVTWYISGGVILSGQGTSHIRVRWTNCNVPQGYGCTLYLNVFVSDGQGCTFNLAASMGQYGIPIAIAPSIPPAVYTGPDTLCVGQVGYFTAPTYYGWFVHPGATYVNGNTFSYPTNISLRYDSVGTYPLTTSHITNAYGGCITDYTDSIVVIPSNWGIEIDGPRFSCINDTMLFTVASTPNTIESWSVSNGVILNGQGTDSVQVLRTNSDSIQISVLMSDGACDTEKFYTNFEKNNILIAPIEFCRGDTSLIISEILQGFNRSLIISGGFFTSISGDSLFAVPDTNSNTISIIQSLDSLTCFLRDTITININEVPNLDLGSDTAFCANSPLHLQPNSNFFSYLWSDGTQLPSLVISNPGLYYLEVSDSAGCSDTDTIQISQENSPFISISSATGNYVMCQSDSSIAITAISNATTYLWSTGSTGSTINADSAGPYWVEATNLAGCTERETVYISRANVPNPSPIIQPNGPIQLCNGDSIVLDAGSSYYSYLWNTNTTNRFLTVSQPGLYFATVYNGLGCAGESQMVEVLMDTNSSPIITLVYDTLWSTPALTYKWRRNSSYIAGATSQFHIPLPSGTYDVEIQNSSGCTMISNTQTWYAIVGMEEVASNDWTLYPNPNQGNFNLEFKSPVNDIEIFIFDGLGKQIFQRHIQDGPPIKVYPIQLESLSEGVYFVILNYNGDQRAMKKMIIRR